MTEEEKIFAGKMFDPRKQELRDLKHKAHAACQQYNAMDEYDPRRQDVIRAVLGRVGRTFYFQGPVQFNYGCHTFIGENFFANFNLTVMDDARIYIGDHVCFGPNVSLMATNHPLIAQERMGLDEQGHTTMASTRPLGPMGSVSGMVWSTGRPAISWAFWIKLAAVPKRVSVS